MADISALFSKKYKSSSFKTNNLSLFIRLIICFLMLSSVAILRDAHFMGYDIKPTSKAEVKPSTDKAIRAEKDGSIVISTQSIASDIKGYGGATPLEITVRDGKIEKIKSLKNAETPDFFQQVEKEIFPKWVGKDIGKAASEQVDGVSGATLSSTAVNATIRRAMLKVASSQVIQTQSDTSFDSFKSIKWIATLLVVLFGAVIPLFYKGKHYRTVQLCLNVIVLGCWSGTFVSHSLIVNYLSNGTNILRSLIPLLMLLIAFVYPLFGKKKHYCMWVCPLGSLQELAGKCVSKKWTLSPKTIKYLKWFHEGLWTILMLLMWSGLCFAWMDYELFSAFLFSKASIFVIIAALLFIGLSLFVNRPYCRFVCPTGCLFHIASDVNENKNNSHQSLHSQQKEPYARNSCTKLKSLVGGVSTISRTEVPDSSLPALNDNAKI